MHIGSILIYVKLTGIFPPVLNYVIQQVLIQIIDLLIIKRYKEIFVQQFCFVV